MVKARIVRELTSLTKAVNEESCNLKLSEVLDKLNKILKHQDTVVVVKEKYKDFHGTYSEHNFIKLQFTNNATREVHTVVFGDENLRTKLLDKEIQEYMLNAFDWYMSTRVDSRSRDKNVGNFQKLLLKAITVINNK